MQILTSVSFVSCPQHIVHSEEINRLMY